MVVPFFHSTVNTGLQEYKLALQLQLYKLGLRFSNFRTNYVRFYCRPYTQTQQQKVWVVVGNT